MHTAQDESILDLAMQGGWYIMLPLALMFLFALFIFFERLLAIGKASKTDKNFMNKIKDYIHEGKLDSAKNLCSQVNNPQARMIDKGISRIGKPIKDISTAIENVGKLEIQRLERNLSSLATVAGAAPMIGFLGTVIGMIAVFQKMKESVNGVEVDQLSGGIMQAMITTVAGLVVGIIAYICYNFIVARVEKIIHNMESASIDFLDLLHEPGK
ncbi:MAG: MotA/TolQ/ExbB proton channel family protein [Flavobacteriales bacterium]|nr:MotA/TolQ/ExbB proton channel family protein [Flavobacteriales bacterium]